MDGVVVNLALGLCFCTFVEASNGGFEARLVIRGETNRVGGRESFGEGLEVVSFSFFISPYMV